MFMSEMVGPSGRRIVDYKHTMSRRHIYIDAASGQTFAWQSSGFLREVPREIALRRAVDANFQRERITQQSPAEAKGSAGD